MFLALAMALAAGLALTPPAYADTSGTTQNYGNGLCLTPDNGVTGALVRQQPCDRITTGARNLMQEWDLICKDANCGVRQYRNNGSGLCLRARGPGGPSNGLQIMLWACNQISDLNWMNRPGPVAGTFVLESRIAGSTGYCLDVPGGSWTPGVALQLYQCNQTPTQAWQMLFPVIE
ncbi:RICIN domain-containing protein [Phytohabitans flavus]|uniref:RICIN domain-containing protein n=1 Tax=Phytohabitans flavus TaxID=1076124 RepID=UPI0015664174|nr:RICIN domain-containing protein [Phytohabitans flavus]